MDKLTKNIERSISAALPNISEYLERRQDINSSKFEARASALAHISKLQEFISGQLQHVAELYKNISIIHEEERSRLAELVKNGTAQPQPVWAQVATKKPKPQTAAPKRSSVNIANGISLPAIRVANFSAVRQDGELYYVESANHFAFILAGQMFHGNIGQILQENAEQVRTIDCRFGKNCTVQGCNFYHDPSISDSKDVRNYHVAQFIYRPPSAERRCMRLFGSIDHAPSDLTAESAGNVSSNRDRAMHELLCAFVLSRHFA